MRYLLFVFFILALSSCSSDSFQQNVPAIHVLENSMISEMISSELEDSEIDFTFFAQSGRYTISNENTPRELLIFTSNNDLYKETKILAHVQGDECKGVSILTARLDGKNPYYDIKSGEYTRKIYTKDINDIALETLQKNNGGGVGGGIIGIMGCAECLLHFSGVFLSNNCPDWPLGWYGDSWTPCIVGTHVASADALIACTELSRCF